MNESLFHHKSVVRAEPSERMDRKCVVVTGATSGIGRATALALGKLGAKLILVARNVRRGTALAERISKFGTGARATFVEADLSSQASMRSAALAIRSRCSSIDVLVNNGGARFDSFELTTDGIERTFATNHLGHFALTGLLFDRLATAKARVITVTSSAAAQAVCDGRWQSQAEASFDRKQAYAKSKLANLVFASALAERAKKHGVLSVAYDPGIVASRFGLNNGVIAWLKHLVYHGTRVELRRPSMAADGVVFLAASPTITTEHSGSCFRDRQLVRSCASSLESAVAESLWSLSVALTGLDPGNP